jgi:hypothetical protein
VAVPGSATTPQIVVTPGDRSLSTTWSHPTATRFQFRYKLASATSWKWDQSTTSTSRLLTGLTNGASYHIEVRLLLGSTWQAWNRATAVPGGSGGPTATPPPIVSPASGTFVGSLSVTMSSSEGGEIRYTLDGSDPDASSPVYSAPVVVTSTTTVKARVYPTSGDPSAVTTRLYTLSTGGGGDTVTVPGSSTLASITVTPGDRTLTATWFNPNAVKYQFRYKLASSSSGWKWDTATTATTRVVTGLVNGTAYDIEVRVLFGGTWKPWNRATATPAP